MYKLIKRSYTFDKVGMVFTEYYDTGYNIVVKGQHIVDMNRDMMSKKDIKQCLAKQKGNKYWLYTKNTDVVKVQKKMKFIDKYDQEHEGRDKDSYEIGCPYNYGYEDYEEAKNICTGISCKKCWNREIPEKTEKPKEDKELTTSPWEPAPKCGMLEADQSKEMVNHPSHYNQGKREVIEEMRILFGDEAVESFCRLNAYKYLRRAEFKGNKKEDLDKAEWYTDYLEMMRGEE